MIYFFKKSDTEYYVAAAEKEINDEGLAKLKWLFSDAELLETASLEGEFIGPRIEMITPWSTNAVEIAQNAGIDQLRRIESFKVENTVKDFDPMLQRRYSKIDSKIFDLETSPAAIENITDIEEYSDKQGLALSSEEIKFLRQVADEIGRPLTDSEIFGFSQVNSEHCRHKIFNGEFVIDGVAKKDSLFQLIKKTSKENPNFLVSAYKDNVAFIKGPVMEQFAPSVQDQPAYFETKDFESVISLKAETHNFPTTVEPFNGAATGSGGEIRDRMAGGKGSVPLAGTAVYMTSYPRTGPRKWESHTKERNWLYQNPKEILIKASNGASDFGNKFGQPLICGSVLTFEHEEGNATTYGFDKVIMLAGGVGYGKLSDSLKSKVSPGENIVLLGGDNYRIGMGGGAVSSVNTGEYDNSIELNAVQRANPEMQKRVSNAVRAMTELDENPVVSIHDHGAGGHLNCLSELVEDTGGVINMGALPLGDQTLSDKEIMSNESQERMGLVIGEKDLKYLKEVAERERAPFYNVGKTKGDEELIFENKAGKHPFHLKLDHLFGASPKTVLEDNSSKVSYQDVILDHKKIKEYLNDLLQLEAVASKDWLTNKVDRSVTGKVALQQTHGEIQLPLNNLGVMATDFKSNKGIATSIGHSPIPAMINAGAGSRLSVTEALTNMAFAPLTYGLKGVSLSANWMWPAKNKNEDARLYQAVEAISDFAMALRINIPTGKDSLSMTQKYPEGKKVLAPGTVIVSAGAETEDVRKLISPTANRQNESSVLIYLSFSDDQFAIGGSSLMQTVGAIGSTCPDTTPHIVKGAFDVMQTLVRNQMVLAGHDVSAGGLITTLLEMNFANTRGGMSIDLADFGDIDPMNILFSEQPGIVLQVTSQEAISVLKEAGVTHYRLGTIDDSRNLLVKKGNWTEQFDIDELRDLWMKSSHLLDQSQTEEAHAKMRFNNYKKQPLKYQFPANFTGKFADLGIDLDRKNKSGVKAAIIREKGVNGDREMAYALYMAGFDVKDVHMTDLVSGREDLTEVNMIVFVGGFSNSDVLGSAKGWAGSFLFNEKAKAALDNFYKRKDTLSLGVCNGCQVMMELELIYPDKKEHPKMLHNSTGKFESAFIDVEIEDNNTVMFGNMAGSRLGIWLAHGEGRFQLMEDEDQYEIPVKYAYKEFPGNPNGSDFGTAALSSEDGRHVAIMPHLERTLFPWNWAHYEDKIAHQASPWVIPFKNAFDWVKGQ